jgi:hypothetical protein
MRKPGRRVERPREKEAIPSMIDLVEQVAGGMERLRKSFLESLNHALRLHRRGLYKRAIPYYLSAAKWQHVIAQQWIGSLQASMAAAGECALRQGSRREARRYTALVTRPWPQVFEQPLHEQLSLTPGGLNRRLPIMRLPRHDRLRQRTQGGKGRPTTA